MRTLFPVILLSLAGILATVQNVEAGEPQEPVTHQSAQLGELLESIGKKTDKQFLVNQRVPVEIVTGPVHLRDVTYPQLLSILRNNDLAAVTVDDTVSIVPVSAVRQYSLPMLEAVDATIPKDAWVTRVIRADNATLTRLVPLLRPMVPQAGHLVADPESNTMLVIAPYGVTEQVSLLVTTLDRNTPERAEQVAHSP